MRKTNVIKTLKIVLMLFIFSLIFNNKVQASEATLSVSNCKVGESFTVTVNIPSDIVGYEGNVSITYSNGNTVSLDKMLAYPSGTSLSYTGNYTGTFKGDVAGQAIVSISNLKMYNSTVFDNLTSVDAALPAVNSIHSLSQTINITEQVSAPAPAPDQTSNNDNNNGSSNNNSSSKPSTPVTLNFKETNEKMYTTRRVNVRQNYGTDSNIIQTLAVGTELTRTGISDGNKDGYSWSRVSYNGITGYLITGALTSEAPVKDEVPEEKEEQPEDKVEEEIPEENSDNVEDTVQALSEKFGAIPEVGVNIIPFMFLGAVVACVVLMIETKRNLSK